MKLAEYVANGTVPGAVGLVARGSEIEVEVAGPMSRDSIFRIASMTKPIVAAAVMLLVEEGRLALDSPIREWLPELAEPVVVRTPDSPVDDVVPVARPITVFDVLTSRCGYGWPDRFDQPAVQLFMAELGADGREVQRPPAPDEWLKILSRIPLVAQPGAEWLYNASSDIQGVLISRVSGQSLPDFLAERVFEPLGMVDTGFWVPADKLDRFTDYYKGTELIDPPAGLWSRPPAFPSGAGGLVSTMDDYFAFCRLLLAEGAGLLSAESVRLMTTNHLTEYQRANSTLFLQGCGWGFGGAVDLDTSQPWSVPGRYGWVGGTGTSAYITPSTGTTAILLTQLAVDGPGSVDHLEEFWEYSAHA